MSTSNYYGNDNDITLQQPSVLDLSPLPKPKRPLSGYNLYYRYKRIKILEATSNYDNETTSTNDDSKSIVIKNIIMCLPGLESIPRHDTMYLSKESIDELRASKIRLVMTGDKLLPNENTRSRLHRKLHGMGFVEMGTIMRQVSLIYFVNVELLGVRRLMVYLVYFYLCAFLNVHMICTLLQFLTNPSSSFPLMNLYIYFQ